MNPILHDFASYYRPHRRLFLLDFGSAVFAGLLERAFPIAVTLFIDRLLPTGDFRLIIINEPSVNLSMRWPKAARP